MLSADPSISSAAELARALIGSSALLHRIERIQSRGRNSRIHRVEAGGRLFALKQYPARTTLGHDRLGAETTALRFMTRNGITNVPELIAVNSRARAVLLTWIDGEPVRTPTGSDISAACMFLDELHFLRFAPGAAGLPLAAEACLSCTEIERQLRARLARLSECAAEEPQLGKFIEVDFQPSLALALAHAHGTPSDRERDLAESIERDQQSPIPADFGFHNALRRPNGSLVFLDFEYFGWDDPVKLAADFLLHPGMSLDAAARSRFRAAALGRHAHDARFAARLNRLMPLFRLRWVLILLNEFAAEHWRRRTTAGAEMSWSDVKARQLAKASALLSGIEEDLRARDT
jgi:hypothetical protein